MKARAIASKTSVDFNRKDLLLAARLMGGAGSLFFLTAFALFWLGSISISYPVIAVMVGVLVLVLALAVGLKLHAWTMGLSENARRLAFILGIIPWNLALIAVFTLINAGPQMEQIQSIDQTAWSEQVRSQVRQLVEVDLSLRSEQVLLMRTAITSGVALLLGIVLMGLRKRWSWLGYSGPILMAVSMGAFSFVMGRNLALVAEVIAGLTRIGAL